MKIQFIIIYSFEHESDAFSFLLKKNTQAVVSVAKRNERANTGLWPVVVVVVRLVSYFVSPPSSFFVVDLPWRSTWKVDATINDKDDKYHRIQHAWWEVRKKGE